MRYVLYRWCHAGINGGGRGPGSISGAGGLPRASVVAVGAALSCCSSGCTQSCSVLCVSLFPPLQFALGACYCGRLLGSSFVCFRSVLLVRALGPALRLGVCLVGFPNAALVHPFPLLRLFVTYTHIVPNPECLCVSRHRVCLQRGCCVHYAAFGSVLWQQRSTAPCHTVTATDRYWLCSHKSATAQVIPAATCTPPTHAST